MPLRNVSRIKRFNNVMLNDPIFTPRFSKSTLRFTGTFVYSFISSVTDQSNDVLDTSINNSND